MKTEQPKIALFRGNGMIGKLIKWQTRGVYSHAAFMLPDGRFLEAREFRGVQFRKLSEWEGIDLYDVPAMEAHEWRIALSFATQRIGEKYDWLAIARFLSRRRMRSNARWFCSELVFRACQQAGVFLLDRVEPWAVSPQMLALSPLLVPAKVI